MEMLLYFRDQWVVIIIPANAAGQLNVLWHNRDAPSVDGAEVGVFHDPYQNSLRGLLQCQKGISLKATIRFVPIRNLPDQPRKRRLANEKLRALLIPPNLLQSHGPRTIAMGLLHSAGRRRALACSCRGKGLPGGLASSGLACGLLGAGHRRKLTTRNAPLYIVYAHEA